MACLVNSAVVRKPSFLLMFSRWKADRLDGNIQNEGNFLRGLALGDQLQNLPLPPAQAKRGGGARRDP